MWIFRLCTKISFSESGISRLINQPLPGISSDYQPHQASPAILVLNTIFHKQQINPAGMNQQGLIFLNATGAPVLSRADSRQMRAHITKSNFAKRRQRASQGETKGNEDNKQTPQQALHRRKRCQQKSQRTASQANPTKLPSRESPQYVPSMQLRELEALKNPPYHSCIPDT